MRFVDKKIYVVLGFLIVFFISVGFAVSNADLERQKVDAVLNHADELFHAMKDHQFSKVWSLLSKESKAKIVESVYKNLLKSNIKTYSKDQVALDFQDNGPLANSFWLGYLKNFSPAMILDESVWQKVDFSGTNKANIVIKYKKAQEPFNLKMYKEDGQWKVGLIETFGL